MLDRVKYTAPISCTINITQRCNLHCLHCSASAGKAAQKEMSAEQVLQLARQLVEDVHVFSISISGGEPLLRDDLFRVLAYLSEKEVGSGLFSNSTLVTDDIAKRLAEESCLRGQFHTSLDGPCASVHDALRGTNAFRRTVRGIERLVASGMKVSAVCIVSKLNLDTLGDIAELAGNLGLSGLSFMTAGLMGCARSHIEVLALTKAELDRAYDTVFSLAREYKVVNGGAILEWPKALAEKLANEQDSSGQTEGVGQNLCHCDICKESVAITPDGWMVPCNKMWDYKIGNVLEEDFLELYRNSPKANAIRELMTMRSDQLEGCQGCRYAYLCSGGCRADAYSLSGSLMGPDKFRCIKRYLELGENDCWNNS